MCKEQPGGYCGLSGNGMGFIPRVMGNHGAGRSAEEGCDLTSDSGPLGLLCGSRLWG